MNAIEREAPNDRSNRLRGLKPRRSGTWLDGPARRSAAIRSEQLLNCGADSKNNRGDVRNFSSHTRITRARLGVSALRSFFESRLAMHGRVRSKKGASVSGAPFSRNEYATSPVRGRTRNRIARLTPCCVNFAAVHRRTPDRRAPLR